MSQFLKHTDEYSSEWLSGIDFDDAVKLPDGGSTCDIFKTRWQRRDVFVKRLKEQYRSKPLYLDALDKEFEIGVSLNHPALPHYLEFHRDYIVMDYVDGVTLAEMIKRNDPWLSDEKRTVQMLKELVNVVDYLHRHNVVHCDIKPDNIMITSNAKNLMLVDFDKSYTDALSDTSGHPSKYCLPVDESGSVAIDFRGIAMVVEKLKAGLPSFRFSRYKQFVETCCEPDVTCEDLLAILDSAKSFPDDKHLKDIEERLYKAFRRKQEPKTMYKCVPRHISIGTLQARNNLTHKDIVEAAGHSDCFRLRNLATAERRGAHSIDQIVVEMFPKNTVYGCCINRESNITIVCPTALSEAGVGNFAYYLALIGGFNYISKEIDEDAADPSSFYIISDPNKNESLAQYIADIKRFSSGNDNWAIFIISSETKKDADIHFITDSNVNTGRETTIIDQNGFDRLYAMTASAIEDKLGIKSDINQYRPAGPKNASVIIGGGIDTNSFTIRIFSELLVWDPRYMAVANALAENIVSTIAHPSEGNMTDIQILKQSGFGYQ